MIMLEITQDVNDVDNTTTSTIDSPTIIQRSISTSVAVQSGESVVLGGLIRENESVSDSGIPGLRKIPWLGRTVLEHDDQHSPNRAACPNNSHCHIQHGGSSRSDPGNEEKAGGDRFRKLNMVHIGLVPAADFTYLKTKCNGLRICSGLRGDLRHRMRHSSLPLGKKC